MKKLWIVLAMLLLASCTRPAQNIYTALTDGTSLQPGDYVRTLTVDGLERSYLLHVPVEYPLRMPVPVVFAFHGGGGNAAHTADFTGFDAAADTNYFLAVYPNGTGRLEDKLLTWNGGTCCGYAVDHNVDDVAFVRAVVEDLRSFATLDEERIYATGMSNGGIMSYRLACEAADLFAAIAPVAGTLNYAACAPSEPVSLLHIHGTADAHLPYAGGVGEESIAGVDFVSVADSVSFWVAANGCTSTPVETTSGNVVHSVYSDCSSGTVVELYTLTGGLHAWPGADGPGWPGGDEPSQELDATQAIWDFFAAHPKQ